MTSRLIRTPRITPLMGVFFLLVCILIIAVIRQYTQLGFDPLAANDIDEIWIYQESYDAFVQGVPPEDRTLPTQPPVILWIDHLAYQFLITQGADATTSLGNAVLNTVRQLTLLPNMLTAVIIFGIGYQLGYPWLGLLAMLIWGISPALMSERNVALAEPWLMPFVAVSFWMMLAAARLQSRRYALLSTVFALLAIITKYNMFPFLGLSVGLVFALCWRDWRRWLPVFIAQGLLIVMTALFLFSVIPLSGMFTTTRETEVTQFITGGGAYVSLNFFGRLVQFMMGHVSLNIQTWDGLVLLGMAVLGIGRILWLARYHERIVLGIIGLVLLSNSVIILFYTWKWDIVDRYASVMSISSALLVVGGLYFGTTFLYDRLYHLTQTRFSHLSSLARPWMRGSLFFVSLVIWLVPVVGRIHERYSLPNTPRVEQALIEWGRLALHDGTVILPEDSNWLWVYFDAEWGGYSPPLPTWVKEDFFGRTLPQWDAIYANYALFRDHNHDALLANQDYEAYASSMTLMRHFETETPQHPWRGSPVYVYWLEGIATPMPLMLGDVIQFKGMTLGMHDDNTTTIRTYWQALQPIAVDYQMFVQWVARDTATVVAQLDTPPTSPRYPTSQWQMLDDTVIGVEVALALPDDVEPGTYDLIMGLYDLSTFARLPVTSASDGDNGADYIVLDTRTVE